MIACNARRLFATCLLCLSLPLAAWAQQGGSGPIQLGPPSGGPAPDSSLSGGRSGISESILENVGSDSVGLIGPGDGGLGVDMWAGSSRAGIERALPHLPADPLLTSAADLARRLLLTGATPPAGPGTGVNFLELRADRLAALGNFAGLAALLDAVPAAQVTLPLARHRVSAHLIIRDFVGACRAAGDHLQQHADLDLHRALVLCQIGAGTPDGALLSLELLQEQTPGSPFLDLAAALLAGQPSGVDAKDSTDDLDRMAWLMTGESVAAEDVATDGAALAAMVAHTPGLPADLRLLAAERLALRGGLSAAALRDLYRSLDLPDADLENVLAAAATAYDARIRALLYLAADRQEVPAARAEVLQQNLQWARTTDQYATVVRVNRDLLDTIPPRPDFGWFAADAALAYYFAGAFERGKSWFGLARAHLAGDPGAAAHLDAMWPYFRLAEAGLERPWDEAQFGGWWTSLDPERQVPAALAMLLLTSALDDPASGDAFDQVARYTATAAIVSPVPAVFLGLERAIADGRRGEALLRALIGLGSGPFAPADIYRIHLVVDALRRAGFEVEARQLALEAALVAGL